MRVGTPVHHVCTMRWESVCSTAVKPLINSNRLQECLVALLLAETQTLPQKQGAAGTHLSLRNKISDAPAKDAPLSDSFYISIKLRLLIG